MTANVVEASADQLARAAIKYKGREGARTFTSMDHGLAFVVREQDEIVGWCWGYGLVRPDGLSMVYIHEIEVDPSARRQGLGRLLLEEVLFRAASMGAAKVFLITEESNIAARELYESCGGQVGDDGDSVVYWWNPIDGAEG